MSRKGLHKGDVGVPSLKLGIMRDAKASVAPWRIATELVADAVPSEYPARDAVAREEHAKPACVEMETRGV
jgi:hypothetical protein